MDGRRKPLNQIYAPPTKKYDRTHRTQLCACLQGHFHDRSCRMSSQVPPTIHPGTAQTTKYQMLTVLVKYLREGLLYYTTQLLTTLICHPINRGQMRQHTKWSRESKVGRSGFTASSMWPLLMELKKFLNPARLKHAQESRWTDSDSSLSPMLNTISQLTWTQLRYNHSHLPGYK